MLGTLLNQGFRIFNLLNAGANWKELQARMGHKSIKTTMDIYAELAPKKKAEAVNLYLREIEKLTSQFNDYIFDYIYQVKNPKTLI